MFHSLAIRFDQFVLITKTNLVHVSMRLEGYWDSSGRSWMMKRKRYGGILFEVFVELTSESCSHMSTKPPPTKSGLGNIDKRSLMSAAVRHYST